MRVLGAKFQSRPDAMHALMHVQATFGVRDAEVAPLADEGATATVLAGWFEDASREEARTMLVGDGGEIVSDVDTRVLS